ALLQTLESQKRLPRLEGRIEGEDEQKARFFRFHTDAMPRWRGESKGRWWRVFVTETQRLSPTSLAPKACGYARTRACPARRPRPRIHSGRARARAGSARFPASCGR